MTAMLSNTFLGSISCRVLWVVALLATLGACASTPPSLGFLDRADELALSAAGEGALEHAPLELKWAREKLTEARSAADGRDYTLARQLAQQSSVNSELAAAKTAAAKARDEARRARESNDALIIELGGGDR
ncbi:MAG: DUF4398 domain-containing protein [Lysobacterales bacterium]